MPLVEAIHAGSDVVISVDTFNAEVARRSIQAGAAVINDTSGLWDPDMARVVADSDGDAGAHAQPESAAQRAAQPPL